jgi:LPXTG-motif cell wall-anchored protein
MANYNDNDLEDLNFGEEGEKPPETPPEQPDNKPSNRNFLIALAVIGGIFVLITLALIAVAALIVPSQNNARKQASVQTLAANTATAQYATDQAAKAVIIPTTTSTPVPTATKVLVTNTPVVAPTQTATKPAAATTVAATVTNASDSQKATLSAQQTQLAGGKFTATVIATSTALPNTGFADEVGLPALLGLGATLILVIFVARRLRSNTAG